METSEIVSRLNKFNEEEELTPQKIRNIFNAITLEDTELEEDEQVTIETIKTMYNEYTIYGLSYESGYVMLADDYDNYIKDICNWVAQCLPDKFDRYFNTDDLYDDVTKYPAILEQCVQFINKVTDDTNYVYTRQDSGDYEGVGYILVDEEYIHE